MCGGVRTLTDPACRRQRGCVKHTPCVAICALDPAVRAFPTTARSEKAPTVPNAVAVAVGTQVDHPRRRAGQSGRLVSEIPFCTRNRGSSCEPAIEIPGRRSEKPGAEKKCRSSRPKYVFRQLWKIVFRKLAFHRARAASIRLDTHLCSVKHKHEITRTECKPEYFKRQVGAGEFRCGCRSRDAVRGWPRAPS